MNTDIPHVVHTGKFKLGKLEITVHVLSNGDRVIPEEDFGRALGWLSLSGLPKSRHRKSALAKEAK